MLDFEALHHVRVRQRRQLRFAQPAQLRRPRVDGRDELEDVLELRQLGDVAAFDLALMEL